MEDVITAIKDLCDAKCIELLPVIHEDEKDNRGIDGVKTLGIEDFPHTLLRSYVSHPKSPPGRIVDQIPWKVSAITALADIFRLSFPCCPSTNNLPVPYSEAVMTTESGSGSERNIIESSRSLNSDDDNIKTDNTIHNSSNNIESNSILSNKKYLAAKEFTIEFIETVSYDMLLLYKAMGTISDSDCKYMYTESFLYICVFAFSY